MKESKTQKKVLDHLKSKGCYCVKIVVANRSGVPDILACTPTGKFLGIEVKSKIGKASKLQEVNLKKIKESNGIAILFREGDNLEDIPTD